MTQYSGSMNDPFVASPSEPPRTSGLAVASLVCSLIFCCPITTILAPVLGLAAIVSIGNNPMRRGKGLALAGIILGIIFTVGQAWGYFKLYKVGMEFMQVVMTGPRDALSKGFSGDIAGYKASFIGPGATAPDDQAKAFLDELTKRYGSFQTSALDESSGGPRQTGQPAVPFPYVLTFSGGTVKAEAEIVFYDEATQTLANKLGYILIEDPDKGNLRYPPDAAAAPTGGAGGGTP
jgi:hypothetical protein